MNKNRKMVIVFLFAFVLCFSLVGCTLQDRIEEYSSGKEQCYLNTENVTRFSYKGNDYTILADTVSNGGLGEWIGYIRQLAAIDENGKILLQENVEPATFQSLADLAEKAPEAAYIIPFLNVYAAPNADDYLIVDVNGGYHKAVISENVKDILRTEIYSVHYRSFKLANMPVSSMKYFHLLISFTVAFIAVIMFFNSVSKSEKFSSLIPQNSTPSSPIFSPIKRIFPTMGHPCLSNS